MKHKQLYGREPKKKHPPKSEKISFRRPDTADFVFLIGTVFILLFLYRMISPPTADTDLSLQDPSTAVAVMSTNVTQDGEEREMLREVTGEPFGYMTGEWNLWEYIGDVMASLLTGG